VELKFLRVQLIQAPEILDNRDLVAKKNRVDRTLHVLSVIDIPRIDPDKRGAFFYESFREAAASCTARPSFAVAPSVRRQNVGGQMIQRLIDKLSQQRREEIVLEIRESNLPAQLFFQSQGFRAVRVLRNLYEDTDEDAYVMHYRLTGADGWTLPFTPRNRISEFDAA
jgi:L-amino acid N-acyltransferase YncA